MFRSLLFRIFIALVSLNFFSCKVYHNTTARYNSYFLANEKLLELEETIRSDYKEDFNNILRVYPLIDSTTAAAYKAQIDYIVEKASIPIQYHETSKWLDDSYLLIGRARLYGADFTNSINTLKYVNTVSTDVNARHTALIYLIRAFTEQKKYTNVDFILDYISRETAPFTDTNERDFYLNAAHYYRQVNDLSKCAEYLQKAIPLVKPIKHRARLFYLLGQIYQYLGKNEASFEAYKAVKYSNPSYDLVFNADLNSSQVFSSANANDVRTAEKNFQKMLKDAKNKDFKDRIYYEMANFNFKNNQLKEGLNALNLSIVHANEKNKSQKGYSYMRFGEIYYDKMQNFERAGVYYDSALSVLTPEMKGYDVATKRMEVLSEFVTYYNLIQENDRLLKLGAMSEAERKTFFEKEIEAEKKAIDQAILANESKQKDNGNDIFNVEGKKWYFYDPASIEAGLKVFQKNWGDRKLEDHWRRSVKPSVASTDKEEVAVLDEEAQKNMRYKNVKSLDERLKIVPKNEMEINNCHQILSNALFNLGKIYHYKLNERENSITTLERLVKEYTKYENLAEAYYMLYIICKESKKCDEKNYAQNLEKNYPNSVFAKLIKDPNYIKESNADNDIVLSTYQNAYILFEKGDFATCNDELEKAIQKYPKSQFLDKLHFLRLMTLPKLKGKPAYKAALNEFISQFSESKLLETAKGMLEVAGE